MVGVDANGAFGRGCKEIVSLRARLLDTVNYTLFFWFLR